MADKTARVHLIEARLKAYEEFDKTVLALSGGGLGLSITFVKDLLGSKPIDDKSFLLYAWISWTLSVVLILLSYFTSQRAIDNAIDDLDTDGKSDNPGGLAGRLTGILNVTAGVLFIVGLGFIICFVYQNMEAINAAAK